MRLFALALVFLIPMPLFAQTSTAYRIYTAQEGERPTDIAQRFNISVHDLLQANPNLVADQALPQGEVVLVPIRATPKPPKAPTAKPPTSSSPASQGLATSASVARAYWVYTVQPGDTPDKIAQRFGITVTALVYANNLPPKARLMPGQVLIVPVLEQPISAAPLPSPNPSPTPRVTQNVSLQRLPVLPAPRIFGYVGTVVAPVARIRSAPRSNAPTWSQVAKGTQLIITTERTGWFGVLMINGATGWVPQAALKKENRPIFWDDLLRVFGGTAGRDNRAVVAEAMRYLGIPYRYGGTSPIKGLDCSAFVQRVFASRGIRLPRTAAEQARVGLPVSLSQLQPGDRLYFAIKGNRIDHCGIYIGNGLFIHASGRHDAVVISSLSEPLYARSLVAIRR